MKLVRAVVAALIVSSTVFAQSAPKSATVPITLDHNRVVIDVYLPLPDGTSKRVRAWVDSGNSDMTMSQRVALLLGSSVSCDGQVCNVSPPREIVIGGMKISLPGVRDAHAPAGDPKDLMDPGMGTEINLPSTVLHNYEVVIDYPNRQFTIGKPGSLPFKGDPAKALISASGLIQVPSKIEGQTYNLALDIGASISLISSSLLAAWQKAHPTWPVMHGAVGAANMWGTPDEAQWEIVRVHELPFGATRLSNVAVAPFAGDRLDFFAKRTGVPTIGLIGGNALRQYVVGIDYAHSTMYLQRTNTAAPDMDVVGLTLHPEIDGRYTVVGIADFDGKPSVPDVKAGDVLVGVDGAPATGATMGQVWSLLGGTPGQSRSLTLERDGKRFTVDAPVRRFLPASQTPVKSPRRNPHRRN
jgi:hypothetical protein